MDARDMLNPTEDEAYLVALLTTATSRQLAEDALERVNSDDFASGAYSGIWHAAAQLRSNGHTITRRGLLRACDSPGAEQTLWKLNGHVPDPTRYPQAVQSVQRCGQLRRLLEATERTQQRALSAEDYPSAVAAAHDELAKLAERDEPAGARSYGDLLDEFATSSDQQPQTVVPTPWGEVNDTLAGGLHAGRLYVIGARTGDGKSLWAHQVAEHAASVGHAALVFSVEMDALEVATRSASAGASIDMGEITTRELSRESWDRFEEYRQRARQFPLRVDDRAELTVPYIKQQARAEQRQRGLHLVVVDYLQLVRSDRNVSREQQVADISRQLKQLSRELQVAVVVPAQLNRAVGDRPTVGNLRESGAIEQDSDTVVLLNRQMFPEGSDMAGMHNGMVTIEVAKNRHGASPVQVELPFHGRFSRIG